MLARSLDRLPVANEAQLLEILVQVKTIIEGRIKLRYLTRDPLTYLFYQRTLYDWLEPLSISAQEGQLNSQLVRLNGHWLSQCCATQDALVKLHGFLFEIRRVAQSTAFQKAGSRFIVFGEKQPEGLACIQHYLQKLPERLSSNEQILLLKQFMQLRRLFTEKYASKNRSFRHSKVNLFYQTQHFIIQTIFNTLSEIDQHLLLAIDLDDNTPLARDFLPAPLSLLANPEKLIRILAVVEPYHQAQKDVYRTDYFSSVENDPVSEANLGNVPQSRAANLSLAFAAK